MKKTKREFVPVVEIPGEKAETLLDDHEKELCAFEQDEAGQWWRMPWGLFNKSRMVNNVINNGAVCIRLHKAYSDRLVLLKLVCSTKPKLNAQDHVVAPGVGIVFYWKSPIYVVPKHVWKNTDQPDTTGEEQ